jgi:hypothetical protein
MSLKYSVLFLLLAASCVLLAVALWEFAVWPIFVLSPGIVTFALLSMAYAGVGPRLLMKRTDGTRSLVGRLLFAPYFFLNGAIFLLHRAITNEPAFAEVLPNLRFGRRMLYWECASVGCRSVLDVAAEFEEAFFFRANCNYLSLPVLDVTAPSEEQLRLAIQWISEAMREGPVYVHCALGHGRSACVVVAYLLAIKAVNLVAEGEARLQSLRPGVRLHANQREMLERHFTTNT